MTTRARLDAHAQRARFSRAETAAVARPSQLPGLLAAARHVAEIPCAGGHFLADYAAAGVAVTLVDACPEMLAHAAEHAAAAGLPAGRTTMHGEFVQDLPYLGEVDLVVMANAALNQLACQDPPAEILAAVGRAVPAGTPLLAQLICTEPDGVTVTAKPGGRSTFYDPTGAHGVWATDRYFRPGEAAGAMLRRRRQRRDGDRLHVEFSYLDGLDAGAAVLHTSAVELRLLDEREITGALAAAGFEHPGLHAGNGGLAELVATMRAGPRP